jgi:hypothetical protein
VRRAEHGPFWCVSEEINGGGINSLLAAHTGSSTPFQPAAGGLSPKALRRAIKIHVGNADDRGVAHGGVSHPSDSDEENEWI